MQDFNSFARYITQFRSAEFFDAVSDFHVLIFMATLDIMPLRYTLIDLLDPDPDNESGSFIFHQSFKDVSEKRTSFIELN